MTAAGLDFGTSNSAIGIAHQGAAKLAPVEGSAQLLPSAVFFDFADLKSALYGRAAIEAYTSNQEGRLMRGLKTILGTSLMEDRTQIGARKLALSDVVGMFIRHLKVKVENAAGAPIDAVVHGRPVHFADGDAEADRKAEATLASLARAAGFAHVSFTYEPLAAAYQYEQMTDREELVLVADIGGGTSDFSIVRIGPDRRRRPDRADDILAHSGVRVGGTDFDRNLSMETVMPLMGLGSLLKTKQLPAPIGPYADLSFWPTINLVYTPRSLRLIRETLADAAEPQRLSRLLHAAERQLGHRIVFAVEAAKIALTAKPATRIDLAFLEQTLEAEATRPTFEEVVRFEMNRLRVAIWSCLAQSGLETEDVSAVFLTGGSSLTPIVAQTICAEVPQAQVRRGDDFLSVAMGLTLEAQRRYG
ncbi:MAG TPA: heat-shock protein [Alphaproteobacteria bacterium]|nr:heat-shock protein [Alphaproteobacteria bacterium]HAJ46326.1 heat-shock protein [Alphaproteobacteria bacterium]